LRARTLRFENPPTPESEALMYEFDEGDWGGWDTDSADEQGNLPGNDS
jgi:hypothetical protein